MDKNSCDGGGDKTFNFELYSQMLANEMGNIDDPVSFYFKKRCESFRKSFLKESLDLERESSLGCLDIDNVSEFDDTDDNNTSYNKFFRNSSTDFVDKIKMKYNLNDIEEQVNKTDSLSSNPEADLEKQRSLAQQTLLNLNYKKNEENINMSINTHDLSKENLAKPENIRKSLNQRKSSIGVKNNWLQPKCSPKTPRIFNDELNSLGGDESDFTTASNNKVIKNSQVEKEKVNKETENNKPSQYSVNSILKEFNQFNINQDIEFDSCTPEEQINRLEEDERQFKSNVLLHNSEISHFSCDENIGNSDLNNDNSDKENKESIGQYFYTRSNRVSSLICSKTAGLNSDIESTSPVSNNQSENHNFKTEPTHSTSDTLKKEQQNSIKNISRTDHESCLEIINAIKSTRNSNESSTSNSTMMIQKFISEMDSGVSPSELAERLMKMYETKQAVNQIKTKMPEIIISSGNDETPKTSKTPKALKINIKTNEKQTENTNVKFSLLDLQVLTPKSDVDSKENSLKQKKFDFKSETFSIIKNKKAFDASTPKFPNKNFQSKNFKSINEIEWDLPNISSVQFTNDIKDEIYEDNDVTIINVNSEKTSKNNINSIDATTINIEDTIVSGDLTLLSKRIEEMKEESVCIVRSDDIKEPVLLTVIEKLADLPKGSVDCTAILPLLRDQFPELLSNYTTSEKNESIFSTLSTIETEDLIMSEPGSWIKLPAQVGYQEKIHSLVEIKKSIFIPLISISKNWLMLSLESINLVQHNTKKNSDCIKILECPASDFVNVIMKDTLVPPKSHQNLQIDLVSLIEAKLDLKLKISLKQLFGKEVQTRSLFLRITTLNPKNLLQILSEETINFGIMADECCDFRTVQISFNGISELPLMAFIEEKNSKSQYFFKSVNLSPKFEEKVEFDCKKIYHFFKEGKKQLLEFQILFQPETLDLKIRTHQVFEAFVILKIASTTTSDGILKKIPMKCTVGPAKFLFSPSYNPFIFSAKEKGQIIKKKYPVKNVGTMPIAFSIKVIKKDDENVIEEEEEKEDSFMVAKTFFLSTNEESSIEITYQANKPAKRMLLLQIEPNGRRSYKVELIGEINSTEAKYVSPPKSCTSLSTKSALSSGTVPAKILASTRSLSWPAVALDKEIKQTLQVKNESDLNLTARIYFQKTTNSFKFLNEDGEKVQKIRKVLKPHQPFTLTVIFHPDSLGIHHNAILLETVEFGVKKIKVFILSGIGGLPNIIISNIKTDLSGCKMLCLQKPTVTIKNYYNTLLFKNTGPFPGFVVITSNPTLSINNELDINPSSFVIDSESNFEVVISQKLKSTDIRGMLSEKDICKLATLNVIIGDELSRLRLKELVESGKALIASNFSKPFISDFLNEKKVNLEKFDDTQSFVKYFFKSLKIMEIAVAVEKSSDTCEPTIFLDEDSVSLFETICTTVQNPLFQKSEDKTSIKSDSQRTNTKFDGNNSLLSSNSSCPLRKKIQDWLENIELFH